MSDFFHFQASCVTFSTFEAVEWQAFVQNYCNKLMLCVQKESRTLKNKEGKICSLNELFLKTKKRVDQIDQNKNIFTLWAIVPKMSDTIG